MNRSIGVAAVLSIAVLAAGANSIYASRLQSTEPPESPPSASDSVPLEGTVPADVETTTGEAATVAEPTIDGTFVVGADAHHLVLRCYGRGAPAIVLEAGTGSSGIGVFPSAFVRPLAEQNMTCVYDRVGTGGSDPPTEPRRTIDDVVNDLHELLAVAAVPGPYLLVGSSGGGLVVVQYATRYDADVAGLVLLDVPSPNPNLNEEFPGEQGWSAPDHMDWVAAERELSMLQMPVGDFPVLIVTAEHGQSSEADQSYWLDLSPSARQIVMPGGHDLYQEDPDAVAEQVLSALASS